MAREFNICIGQAGIRARPFSEYKFFYIPGFRTCLGQIDVNAEYRLATEALHLTHLHAVMGISMGGMQTFEWMVDYPDFMDVAIPIVGSTRLTGYDLLLWHAEENALKTDPAWHKGHYKKPPPLGAVQAIHQMNLTTPANYARAHPPEKFAADYAAYFSKGVLPSTPTTGWRNWRP